MTSPTVSRPASRPASGPTRADLDAALLLLSRLGIDPADLSQVAPDRRPAPTFAEYIPLVSAAVTAGTRRVYGSYWNRIVDYWGQRRLDEPTPTEVKSLTEQIRAKVVVRRNARGGRSAAEHCIAALRCLYRHAVADGHIAEADNPARKVSKPRRLPSTRCAVADARLAEINDVAATTGDDPALDCLILRLHTETACRRGGGLALLPADLDPVQCLIRLREKGETVRWQPVSPTPPDGVDDGRQRDHGVPAARPPVVHRAQERAEEVAQVQASPARRAHLVAAGPVRRTDPQRHRGVAGGPGGRPPRGRRPRRCPGRTAGVRAGGGRTAVALPQRPVRRPQPTGTWADVGPSPLPARSEPRPRRRRSGPRPPVTAPRPGAGASRGDRSDRTRHRLRRRVPPRTPGRPAVPLHPRRRPCRHHRSPVGKPRGRAGHRPKGLSADGPPVEQAASDEKANRHGQGGHRTRSARPTGFAAAVWPEPQRFDSARARACRGDDPSCCCCRDPMRGGPAVDGPPDPVPASSLSAQGCGGMGDGTQVSAVSAAGRRQRACSG
jgi:hypothetical protein